MAIKNQLSGRPLEIVLTATNSAAQAWYGYDQGVISGILISKFFINTFPQTKNSDIQGITASCFSLGNLAGCLLAALFGDRLGRKNTLRAGAFFSTVGAILQFSSFHFPQFIVGRVINGLGNAPHVECIKRSLAEDQEGESFGSLWDAHTSIIPLNGDYPSLSRQLVPCMVMCCLLPLLPDSPRWLVMRDRRDEAHEALRRYLGKDLPLDEPAVINELLSIEEAYNIEKRSRISLKEVILCRDRSGHLKRLLLGCGGQFMQQFGGINALNYYFPIILTENIGLSEFMARVLTGCNATSYMISSGLCFWMIERFGRRSLMLSGLVLQCWAYVMVAISVALLLHAPSQWGAVAITFLFFYYAAFGCTWGMVPWVYQAEINSLSMRTTGTAAATATNWLFGFVCTQFTPTGIRNIGYRFYIIFAAFNLLFVPVVYFLYPETSNRTLEDIDEYFDIDSGHPTIIAIGDKVTKSTARPQEAIDAEIRRVTVADKKVAAQKGSAVHVEHVDDRDE
ncbi:Sugar transporter STL1 [Lachnellula suecica]|uniref:Sugar transporter STL1 n=1 Tax=Lachnellula suecica TaxID=602035 RepID=A0A8T9CD58_9HELO|nr:Sugar transporter STL1 [Lachnellula suecica]